MTLKAPEQIRIKTLEEIKLEKAAKCQDQKDSSSVVPPNTSKTNPAKAKFTKRVVTVKLGETFSESLRSKRKQQDEPEKQPNIKKADQMVEPDPASAPPHQKLTDVEKVRVKTLEEIRREKAARVQAQQDAPSETKSSTDTENVPKIRRLPCIKKLPAQSKTLFLVLENQIHNPECVTVFDMRFIS